MSKAATVIRYYVLCNRLKDVIRTGWQKWHVERGRLESVAEHIYGVQMLAIAMQSEYQYKVDILKVILMLAVHELEEIAIGDLIPFEISKAEKVECGHAAVEKILDGMLARENIMRLIMEFDQRQTKEALFAHHCDKLEADLQCKLYDEESPVDVRQQSDANILQDPLVQKLMSTNQTWSEMWLDFGQATYGYDKNFLEVSKYAKNHTISNPTIY